MAGMVGKLRWLMRLPAFRRSPFRDFPRLQENLAAAAEASVETIAINAACGATSGDCVQFAHISRDTDGPSSDGEFAAGRSWGRNATARRTAHRCRLGRDQPCSACRGGSGFSQIPQEAGMIR